MKKEEVILSFKDSLLRNSDVELLKGPYWLNDNVIGFYFEYLEDKLDENLKDKVRFCGPEVTQLLKMMGPPEYPSVLGSLLSEQTDFILFAVNNCEKYEETGGSHWSLIVFSKPEKTCYHLDSFRGTNHFLAQRFASDLMKYLLSGTSGTFVEVKPPQQQNGYDCGIFLLIFAKIVCQHLINSKAVSDCEFSGASAEAKSFRKTLMSLIEELRS